VDIFNYQFLVIPISEHHHWKLAIIVNFGKSQNFSERRSFEKPCILLFDSLGSEYNPRSPIFINLRNYLEREWLDKKGGKIICNHINVKSYTPKVPCQINSTDCGVFIIQYLIEFAESLPVDFSNYRTVNTKIGQNWFQIEKIEKLRYKIRKTIISLISNEKDSNDFE